MARTAALVDTDTLHYGSVGLPVGSPNWFGWLEGATSFAYRGSQGQFTARKERSGSGRGGWYWKAYRRINGRLRRFYLGSDSELTLARLQAAAEALATPTDAPAMQPIPLPPAQNLLLRAKISAPPLRSELLARPRLLAGLDDAIRRPLVLLTAPAGTGKTTLLASWLATLSERQKAKGAQHSLSRIQHSAFSIQHSAAWLSLDEGDNDPARFWAYVAGALQMLHPGLGALTASVLQSPQPPPLEATLAPLVNELAALYAGQADGSELVLVLDDYHLIHSEVIQAGIAFLIEHLPQGAHLVIASRSEPPLPLARMRARGSVAELGASELAFTSAETTTLLRDVLQLVLAPAEMLALGERTEGWAAGLQLAALALQGGSGLSSITAAADNRYVMDYLTDEVLRQQPAHIQQFLLHTSLLDRMCADLCDDLLTSQTDADAASQAELLPSQQVLEQLERANLFIVPLDAERRWYRYHQLFAALLRARLRQFQPELEPLLHERAARWYASQNAAEQQHFASEAVRHALASGNTTLAAELVEEYAPHVLMRGEVTTVIAWLDALPTTLAQQRPALGVRRAWTLVLLGQFDAAEPVLRAVEQHSDALLQGEILAVRAAIARLQRDTPRTIVLAHQALALLRPENAYVRGVMMLVLGGAYTDQGDLPAAVQAFAEASGDQASAGSALTVQFALREQATLYSRQGQLRRAAEVYAQAQQLITTRPPLPADGALYAGLGELQYERNELQQAARTLQQAVEHGRQGNNPEILLGGALMLAHVYQAEGRRADADAAMSQAEQAARRTRAPRVLAWLEAEQALLRVAQGDMAAAQRWAEQSAPGDLQAISYLREIEYLALARVRVAQNDPSALPLIEQLLESAERAQRRGSVLKLRALQALALREAGRENEALASLRQALVLAAPEGYARSFIDLGQPMKRLLNETLRRLTGHSADDALHAYLRRLLEAFPAGLISPPATAFQPPASPLLEPLTEREHEILLQIETGRSNQEIADTLRIAISTVKKHINGLYAKLLVRSRTQALARARELGLL